MSDNGNLKLTAQQFNSLKGAIKDISGVAKEAQDAIRSIFDIDTFGEWQGEEYFTGKIEKSLSHVSKMVDALNAKLAITNVRMASIFNSSAKAWEKTAKAIDKVTKATSGGKGGKRGGGSGESGWWNQGAPEDFNPHGSTPSDDPGSLKSNWVSSLDAAISASKHLEKIEKEHVKHSESLKKNMDSLADTYRKMQRSEADFIAKQRERSADATFKKLTEQTKQAEKAKAMLQKQQKADADFNAKHRAKSADATYKRLVEQTKQAAKHAKEMEDSYKAVAARSRITRNEEYLMDKSRKEKAREEKQKKKQNKSWDSSIGGFLDKTVGRVVEAQWMRFKTGMAFKSLFGGSLNTLTNSGTGGGAGRFSRFFGGAGAIGSGMVGKFRMFQKPFPGSERNIFALGDLAAGFNNIIYGIGGSLEHAFTGLTQSAIGVSRSFSGVVTGIASVISPALGALLGSVSDLFIGVLEKLSSVVSSVIGGLTRMATALTGFATRTVEAAANFTEAVNAARVISGPNAAKSMMGESMRLQREYGLSATDAMRGMGRIAGMLVQQGNFTPQEAGMHAEEIARQLADVASVNNRNLEDLMRDFMSGLAGRFTPMRKNMMSFQAPVLDAYAKASGIKNPGLRTDLTARVRMYIQDFARQAELFAGDLERTRYEFANQRRKFLGGFEALFLSVGRILEPFGKAVVISANDLMDQVLGLFGNMADNPYEVFKKQLDSFAWYVVYAKNAIVEMAKSAWDSRGLIADWASYLGKSLVTLAVSLAKYSVSTLQMFASLVSGIGGVLPMIERFGGALESLTRFIDRNFLGGSEKAQTERLFKSLTDEKKSLLANSEFKDNADLQKKYAEANAKLEKLKPYRKTTSSILDNEGRVVPGDEIFTAAPKTLLDEISGTSNAFSVVAAGLGKTSTILDNALQQGEAIVKGLNVDLQKINQETEDLKRKIEPVSSMPGKVTPAPPLSMAGNLVRYFDPAAFRDAVQEREVNNAQIRTADATEGILEILQRRGGLDSPMTTLTRPSQFNMPGGGVIVGP